MNETLQACIAKYPELSACREDIERAFQAMRDCYADGGKLLLAGNGGSAADCEHIVGELMKGFMSKRPIPPQMREKLSQFGEAEGGYMADRLQGALPAISLVSHTAIATAYANDVAADMVFAQQVYGYGKPGDVLIGLSTSGNSRNVIRALQVARALGMRTIGMTGSDGGEMKRYCDVTIRAPYEVTPDIQERHLPIYHALCVMLERHFFGEKAG
ncbi:SIS domain-containing protein [Paenibacillus hemerocallicola]|jgi:D-sedoheptulose 7-phosphate isomerase|uniref:SIS domain-containing protein n=1 Tax=Paenibacillus hemerocallicola TaxID=1172614 RepID=A0A5C4T9P8_9BACL|nr:SIS domain-containing protein [Paenibacillus hemerocallicola]TNJ65615.1 SIS domain-containing protein [Paenibacillus hemerocallicola]